jgi:hypothetical protein
MKMGGKCIENLLFAYDVGRKTLKIYKYKKTPFHVCSLENGPNKF